ncbi:MAG: transcription elongation factor GreA [Candidatus Omnitrophica bacterium]|nr:transcription elongation factor GreA [Candidatus Omnitrophota bacterium]
MDDVYLTREGYEKLSKDLDYLKITRRKEISKAIGEARLLGDLSENAEYDAAKDAQALNEKRISDLEDKLSRSRIIEDEDISSDEVRIGAKVRLKDLEFLDEFEYILVSEEEADYDQGKISVSSPVGKALIGHKAGDKVKVQAPAKTLKYKIIEISR